MYLKICLVVLGFTMAIIATSTNTFGVKPSGYCDYCETHICGTTAAGTVCYGYWHEVEVE